MDVCIIKSISVHLVLMAVQNDRMVFNNLLMSIQLKELINRIEEQNKGGSMKTKYKTIYEEMKNAIESGEYKVGDLIPDEMTMCDRYGCSRMTVKKAYDLLVLEGYIYRKQGQGSFVLSRTINNPFVEIQEHELSGLTRATGGKATSKVIHFNLIFATEEIAKHLNIRTNDPVYDILRLRQVKGKPYVLEQTYMSPNVIPGITEDVLHKSVYEYIENELKLRISAAQKITSADKSNDLDHRELKLAADEPVLVIEQVAFLDNGTPFEYSICRHRYDLFRFADYSLRK